jgi:hypothetical protein
LQVWTFRTFSRLKLLLWLVLGSHVCEVDGQNVYKFEHLGYREGLESNWYFHIAEDSLGCMWFGGHTGLTRYDGRRAIHFMNNPQDPSSLGYDEVFRVLPFKEKEIWCSTLAGGVSILNSFSGSFTNLTQENGTWPSAITGEIIKESDSTIYFLGNFKKSLYEATLGKDGFTFEEYPLEFTTSNLTFWDNKARYIFKDKKNPSILWIIGNFRIYTFNIKTKSLDLFHEFDFLLKEAVGFDLIPAYEWIDDDHLMLYLINHGYYAFSLRTKQLEHLFLDRENLPHHCRYIKKLTNGEFLLGYSDGRLFGYQYPEKKARQIPMQYPSNPTPWIEYIYQAKNGDIYVATSGAGIMHYKEAYHKIRWLKADPLKPNYANFFGNASLNEDGTIVLFNKFRVDSLYTFNLNGFQRKVINGSNIPEISKGNICLVNDNLFVTHNGKSVYDVDLQKDIIRERKLLELDAAIRDGGYIVKIECDKAQNIWIYGNNFIFQYADDKVQFQYTFRTDQGSMLPDYIYVVRYPEFLLFFNGQNLIHKLDLKDRTFSKVLTESKLLNSIHNQPIIYKDNLFIPNNQYGMLRAELRQDSLVITKQFTTYDGLLSNNVYALSGTEDYIWISTGMGFQRYNPSSNRFFDFNYRYVLPDLYIDRPVRVAESGTFALPLGNYIYFGYLNELIPEKIDVKCFINSLIINQKETIYGFREPEREDILLTYLENGFRIGWSIFSEAAENAYQIAYRLEGLNEEWTVLKEYDELKATYTNLSPGKYNFQVKIIPKTDQSSFTVIDQRIVVKPAFWQSWWFRLVLILVILALLTGGYKWRTNSIKKAALIKQDFDKKLAQIQWQNLEAQVNPHFMFNSLNAIKRSVLQGNVMEASEFLSRFSQLLRHVLKYSKQNSITLADELNTLKLYIDLELLRFESKFKYDLLVKAELVLENVLVPGLFLQPFLEDSIWRTISHQGSNNQIAVHIHSDEDKLQISIFDCREIKEGYDYRLDQSAPKGRLEEAIERLTFIAPDLTINRSVVNGSEAYSFCTKIILPLKTNQ